MASSKPVLIVLGGINGCGKSTLAAAKPDVLLGQETVNPDVLTKDVTASFSALAGDGANLVGVERAEKIAW